MAKKKEKKSQQRQRFFMSGEWPVYLILTLLLLLAFGLISLFSASYVSAYIESGNSYQYITKQSFFAAVGVVAMFAIATVDYHIISSKSGVLYFVGLVLLAIVQFTCDPLNGAKRWLYWESSFLSWFPSIQVSEIVKFVMIGVTAHIICQFHANKKPLQAIVYPVIMLIPVLVFMLLQPHLSGSVIILGIVLVMIFMSGVGMRYILMLVGVAVPVGALGWYYAVNNITYVSERLEGYTLDVTQMDWQTKQSIYAIGSGGLTGLGFGNGVQKQLWLPEATNDFIFSVVCEELGFIGAMVVIFLFFVFIIQGFYIAMEAADLFGSLLAIGITSQIALQFAFNIGVVTSLLPNTGISLPFFSSGNTSLLMLLGEVGVLIAVARGGLAAKKERAEEKRQAQLQVIQGKGASALRPKQT